MGTIQKSSNRPHKPLGANIGLAVPDLDLSSQGVRLIFEAARAQSGQTNMSRDSDLLDEIRHHPEPTMMIRTYCWEESTVSLGKHQPDRDKDCIHQTLRLPLNTPLVTRPTGGRAILHGDDIAFAFITNAPIFLRLSLKDSYCVFTFFLKETLHQLGYQTISDCNVNNREYLRSALCFETKTPSDILSPDGKKLVGCAQARRAGGILQHGSAFLGSPPLSLEPIFSKTLFQVVQQSFTGFL